MNRSVDAFYTPAALASSVAEALELERGAGVEVADFAVGAGSLLSAVRRLYPQAELFGTDISRAAVDEITSAEPDWTIEECDFLDTAQRSACSVTATGRRYDAIVLNPPFSYRGGRRTVVSIDGADVSGSPSAVFVAVASRYIDQGQIAAILPQGTLETERDADVWEGLGRRWAIQTLAKYGRGVFPGLAAATLLVHMTLRAGVENQQLPAARKFTRTPELRPISVDVVRGTLPMHRVRETSNGASLVHTTGLTRDGLRYVRVANPQGRRVCGPAVLLPRIGKPAEWKVQLYDQPWPVVLSDCVIGLRCESRDDAIEIIRRVSGHWIDVETAWTGSCAPYMTLARLRSMLNTLDVFEDLDAGAAEPSVTASAAW